LSCENEQLDIDDQDNIDQSSSETYVRNLKLTINGETYETTQTNETLDISQLSDEARGIYEKGFSLWVDDTVIAFDTVEKLDAYYEQEFGDDVNNDNPKDYSRAGFRWLKGILTNARSAYRSGTYTYLDSNSTSDGQATFFHNYNNERIIADADVDAHYIGNRMNNNVKNVYINKPYGARAVIEIYDRGYLRGRKQYRIIRKNKWASNAEKNFRPSIAVSSFEVHFSPW